MDYYAVLGVARDAEDIVITAAYKAMVKKNLLFIDTKLGSAVTVIWQIKLQV